MNEVKMRAEVENAIHKLEAYYTVWCCVGGEDVYLGQFNYFDDAYETFTELRDSGKDCWMLDF